MTHNDLTYAHRSSASIDQVIDAHGAAKVLLAALRALLRPLARTAPRPRPPDAHDLSAHLRNDVGLPPVPQTPRLEVTILTGRL